MSATARSCLLLLWGNGAGTAPEVSNLRLTPYINPHDENGVLGLTQLPPPLHPHLPYHYRSCWRNQGRRVLHNV